MQEKSAGKFDLTSGSILDKLLVVAVPIMGTQLMQMAYNLTDMFWLGRVDSDAVASAGTAGMYLWLSMAFMMIGRMGSEIGVAQFLGRGEKDTAREYSQNSLFLAVVLGVLFGGAMILFRGPLIGFFNIQEANVAADAAQYLAITGGAIPATYITGVLAGSFNGSGNARVPFFINAVGLIINMVLDPVFIFGLNLGIAGAAIATSIGQIVVCLLFLVAIKCFPSRPFPTYRFFAPPQKEKVRQIFKWSTPIGTESMFFTLLAMIVSRFVAAWGADALAVQKIGSQIESLSWLLGGGFSTAITAFVGQNYGAGKWSRIHRGFRISLITILCWGAIVTAILVLGGRVLFSLFLPDPRIVEMGVSYLNVLAICQIPSCLEAAAAGAFRGIGKTLPPSIVSISGNVIRVPIAYLLSLTSLGLDGIWWGVTLGATLRGLWIFAWYLYMSRKQPQVDLPG